MNEEFGPAGGLWVVQEDRRFLLFLFYLFDVERAHLGQGGLDLLGSFLGNPSINGERVFCGRESQRSFGLLYLNCKEILGRQDEMCMFLLELLQRILSLLQSLLEVQLLGLKVLGHLQR